MAAALATRHQVDLVECIDWTGVECLNEKTDQTYVNAMRQGYRDDTDLQLESDTDEQLLLYIPFNQVVKLHSVIIKASVEDGPKTVKLFVNRHNMGFGNVSDFPASDVLDLTAEQLQGKPVLLKYVKFQNVRSLTVFIEDSQAGTEETKIQKLAIVGSTVETTNMSDLKKVGES